MLFNRFNNRSGCSHKKEIFHRKSLSHISLAISPNRKIILALLCFEILGCQSNFHYFSRLCSRHSGNTKTKLQNQISSNIEKFKKAIDVLYLTVVQLKMGMYDELGKLNKKTNKDILTSNFY